jgi:DNA excision repair protein ERCC-5
METSSKSKKRKPGGNYSDGKGKGLEHEYDQGSDDLSSDETERVKKIFMTKHVSMFSCEKHLVRCFA